jgi:hypothetical protein
LFGDTVIQATNIISIKVGLAFEPVVAEKDGFFGFIVIGGIVNLYRGVR